VAQDHNDIYTIVEKLALLEGRITPATVKKGLNPQQKSVPQLPALFKPKTISVLGAKKDPKHPMTGYAVGADESLAEEQEMAEDVLEKVKKSFTEFIKSVEEEIEDSDIKEKKHEDTDLKNKEVKDRALIAKVVAVPTESASIKTIANEMGIWEMHGNERDGFEIQRSGRCLPTKFSSLDEAEMAVEMFAHRRKITDEAQDYLDEE
jgi:hypothetical protein